MNKADAKQRIDKLRGAVNHHRYLYHVLDKQEISDAALDSLKHELYELEQQYPDLITPDSPTQRVGGKPLDKFKKVRHATPLLSIEDVFSPEELADWLTRIQKLTRKPLDEFFCEIKMDGLAVSLVYEDGVLLTGATRGDGAVGEDVVQNLKNIEAIPLVLRQSPQKEIDGFVAANRGKIDERRFRATMKSLAGRIEVRGEVFMTKASLVKLNKEQEKAGLPTFANPRNAAAGGIRQLDPEISRKRRLDFYGYALLGDLGLTRHHQAHEVLQLLGVKINPLTAIAKSLDTVGDFHGMVAKRREKLAYWTDGVVVVINDDLIFSDLGVIGKTPRGVVAYKFPAEQATTVVEDIAISVGRTGALTPVALLRAVHVAGTTVTHASLHNMDEIERLGVRIGDTVVIEKAGDIIPKVIKVLTDLRTGKEKTFRVPAECPVCGAKVERHATGTAKSGVVYYCVNPDCYAKTLERILHFVSKGAADMNGLGDQIIARFIEEGLVADAADLYRLKEEDIAGLERFGELSAKNIVAAIQGKRTLPFVRFLVGLGMRHVGGQTAVALAAKFKTVPTLRAASLEELTAVEDVGPVVAQSIREWFDDAKNAAFLEKLLAEVVVERGEDIAIGPLTGKTFVLTGSLESFTREEAKQKIRALGGEVSESVSSATDYVVVGTEPGSKAEKAKKLGVTILNEKDFAAILKRQ